MYGGMCQAAYFRSCLSLQEALLSEQMAFDWWLASNESLITRARNAAVATFLSTDFQKLLFIDADIEFLADDVVKLWNVEADIAVGVYPMKKPGEDVYAAWVKGKLVTDLDQFEGLIEVDYAGTGFMMIDRSVFGKMTAEEYEGRDLTGQARMERDYFQTPVHNGVFESEDYYFCRKAREAGLKVVMDPSIRLKHWGTYAYGN